MSYLSAEWLARLPPAEAPASGTDQPPTGFTLRQVVRGAPDGEATYDVRITDGVLSLRQAGSFPADVTLTCDYATASEIASGHLSAQAALAAGRIKLSGDLRVVSTVAADAAGVDPLPPELRSETEMPG